MNDCTKSPSKKKVKLDSVENFNKRQNQDNVDSPMKRSKHENVEDIEKKTQSMKRKNFVSACENVSFREYFNLRSRYQLINLLECMNANPCRHQIDGSSIKEVPGYVEESFKIEIKTNMWSDALEVCQLSLTENQYLSSGVLKDIVEIMLNAHDDTFTDYSIDYLIDKCQLILSKNFTIHPPCPLTNIRTCYNDFLTSPMSLKENTFSNRKEFQCDKGLVKYCFNRLEYEISAVSKDGPLVDKVENVPEEMKQTVKGLYWQKEKFEIFELLDRNERIKRIFAVLESLIELLQYDLAIWHSRYTSNLGSHIMRSHKPLMAFILWSNNVLLTGAVNNNCRQILNLFVKCVHLQYPERCINILSTWLNTMVQTFYICENNSNIDYPNAGKYCGAFANAFYKLISELPHPSIMKIVEKVEPKFMQTMVGTVYIKSLLSTNDDEIINIVLDFLNNAQWENFPKTDQELELSTNSGCKPKNVKNILKYLSKKCKKLHHNQNNTVLYPKTEDSVDIDISINQNDVIKLLFITLNAFLDAYKVEDIQCTLNKLNEDIPNNTDSDSKNDISSTEFGSYRVTEQFIKKYRSIFQALKMLMLKFLELKDVKHLPSSLSVFDKIGLLGSS